MSKMNQERKAMWLAALRGERLNPETGEAYAQAHGELRGVSGGHCCLGVACDIYRSEGEPGVWSDGDRVFVAGGRHAVVALPRAVSEWFGLSKSDPDVRGEPVSVLNDGLSDDGGHTAVARHTFAEIADLIEAEL